MQYYEKGSGNIDVTAVALAEADRVSYQRMDIEDSIAITRLVDITKCQGEFSDQLCEQSLRTKRGTSGGP